MTEQVERVERQEIHCHECGKYVQFPMDLNLNGNHVLTCPICGHEHCRVVMDGVITGDRWDQRNGPSNTWYVCTTYVTVTATSSYRITTQGSSTVAVTGTADSSYFLDGLWRNTYST